MSDSDVSGSNMEDAGAANHCSAGGDTGAKDDLEMETADNNHCAAKESVSMETADNNHCAAKSSTCTCDTDSDSEAESPRKSADALDPGDGELCLGSLKKDDSGIVCEKSPVRETESSKTDLELNTSSGTSRTHLPSTSNESEGVVADFADDSEANGPLDVSLKTESADDEEDEDEDEDDVEVSVRKLRKETAQKRRRSRSRSADSSSQSEAEDQSSSPDESHDNDAAKSEDEEMDVGPSSSPRDPWKPLHELRRREVGHNTRFPAAYLFRTRTGSSVNLVQRLELQGKLEHHDGCVNALHFNDSGTLLASGSDDLNIVIWDWAHARKYMVFDSGHRSNVFQSKFMPYTEDMHIVSCARDGQVRLAELSTTGVCKGTKKLAQHRGAAHKLALLSDSSHVFYSCGEDGVIYEIDLRQDKPNKLCTTKENNKKVQLYSIHSNPFKSHEFCVGGRDHFIRIYDKRMLGDDEDGAVVKKYCPDHLIDSAVKANVTCAVYNFNGTEILGTYNDEHIYLFDNEHSDGANYIHRYLGHRNNATVKGVNFYGPRSEFVISGSDCSNIILWDKETEKIVQFFHGDEGGVINVLEPHPHCPVLATSGLDHDVKVWAPTAKQATNLDGVKQLVRSNRKEREEERASEPDMIDGQMLWLLMQHLRRTTRRRAREEGEDASTSTSDSDNQSEDDDGSEEMPEGVQCASS